MASHRAGQAPELSPAAHYSGAELEAAIRACGVLAGDTVVAYVGMGMLGFPDQGATEEAMFQTILGAYRRTLGPSGTLLVPTYSFSFGRQEPFDPAATPSRIGPFSERFRRLPGVARSADPMMSVAGLGPAAAALFKDLPKDCFGENSVYARLRRRGAKICNVGVGFRYATYIHHVEEREKVPYRFLKSFSGRILAGGRWRVQRWLYFARILADNCQPDLARLEREAVGRNLLRKARVGKGEVTLIACEDLDRLCSESIAKDKWFLARGPEADLERLEARRAGEAPRPYPLSSAYDSVLNSLVQGLPATTHVYPTGTRVGKGVVQERWTPRAARLETSAGETLLSMEREPLTVPYYCPSFSGEVDAAELRRRLMTHRDPGAVPLESKLFFPEWGFCCRRDFKSRLPEGRYKIFIDTVFSYGHMKAAHCVVPGRSAKSVVIIGHVDEGPSGAAAAAELTRRLFGGPKREWTYHLLLAPKGIGPAAFFEENPGLLRGVQGLLVLEGLGLDAPLSAQSPEEPSPFHRRLLKPLGRVLVGNGPWLSAGDWGAVVRGIPRACISRAVRPLDRRNPYDGFRSSRETPSLVSPAAVEDSMRTLSSLLV